MVDKKIFKEITKLARVPLWLRFVVLVIIVLVLGRALGAGPFTKKIPETQAPVAEGPEVVSASGMLEAEERVLLHFQTSGKLIWLGVKEGETVGRWQAVAKLDTTRLNADYQRARSDLRSAEATLERIYDEVKGHEADETFAQKEARTIAEVAKDKAYEAVIKAQKDLQEATLISPIAGVVVETSSLVAGQNVLTSDVIEIVNPNSFVFTAQLDEIDYERIRVGQKARVSLDAFPDEEFPGEVTLIGRATIITKTGITAIPVKIKIPTDPRFIDGLAGDIEFLD